ncbi:LssY C-terminal domain-containing protein [Acidipila sp. EB88]|uniref:LssY C-terminal domain-containing protein n=1 Tax=Acidipila sp. EB88 TaxID=2305226 RepID=UPI001315715B|nr:LssY C-terminal domain-containing protein [Acidipila sp. EB88]
MILIFPKVCAIVLLSVALRCEAQATVSTGTSAGVEPAPHAYPSDTIQPIPVVRPLASALASRKRSYTLAVPGTGAWVDAGFAVSPDDHLAFSATGSLTLADQRRTGPVGAARGWKDLLRGFPLAEANTGALIGTIGNSEAAVPFAIGESLSEDAPASGELFLAANVSDTLAGTGRYTVTLNLSKTVAVAPAAPPFDLRQASLPALFAAIPRRVADASNDPGDVVNFALLGTEAQVKKAFTAAGWVEVDKTTDAAVVHGLIATLSKKAYLEMPMSTLYLFGRPQDLSYARGDPLAVALVRHHLRLWNSGEAVAGRTLWVGSATHDNGLERDQRDNGITHHIDPQIDQERDFIKDSFTAAGALDAGAYVTPADAVHQGATATGGSFRTDGRVVVLVLR